MPGPGELLLTEIMRDPAAGGRTWIELLVLADGPRNLAGCELWAPDGLGNYELPADEPILVDPDHLVLLAGPGAVNDGLQGVDASFGALDLTGVDGILGLVCDGQLVDGVDLSVGDYPADDGRSIQLSPSYFEVEANDDSDAWCSSYIAYGFGNEGTPGAPNISCNTDIDWCRMFFPAYSAIAAGGSFEVAAHVFDGGLTDQTEGAPDTADGFLAEVGYGPDGGHPLMDPDSFTWFEAVADEDPPSFVDPDEDRYLGSITIDTSGVYDYAARFSADGGYNWLYCDLDGSSNAYQVDKAGHATVF